MEYVYGVLIYLSVGLAAAIYASLFGGPDWKVEGFKELMLVMFTWPILLLVYALSEKG